MRRDSVMGTLAVAAVLCIVCSVLVSGAAVALRPKQNANKDLFQKKNILIAAGLIDANERVTHESVASVFENIETQLIDLKTGTFAEDVDPEEYDQKAAARNPKINVAADGLAGIQRREPYSLVYLVKDGGQLKTVVLPVYGKGLWSTMYGFLALESDLNTVAGLTFYTHGETPGLGGEVDNPAWKALWPGKTIRDDKGEIRIEVIKGRVDTSSDDAAYQVDGLSGATITSRGVSNLVQYWTSPEGFGKFLDNLKTQH